MIRPSWDSYFMKFAEAASTRGTCDRKFVGAVIVANKQVVATGYNGSAAGMPHCSAGPHKAIMKNGICVCLYCNVLAINFLDYLNYEIPGKECPKNPGAGHDMDHGHCVRTIHAEMNALAQAAKRGVVVEGATIYTTASPCWDCFRVLVNAGIKRFVFREAYREGDNSERIKQVVETTGVVVEQLTSE